MILGLIIKGTIHWIFFKHTAAGSKYLVQPRLMHSDSHSHLVKKKTGSLGFYLFMSLLISTLCDSLGFPSILGDTQLRQRLPIKEGGRNAEWHRGRWWEIKRAGERKTRLVKEENRLDLHVLFFFFYNPTLVCALAFVNWVRPVTLAAGMLYVLVPIQLFVSVTQEARREALT